MVPAAMPPVPGVPNRVPKLVFNFGTFRMRCTKVAFQKRYIGYRSQTVGAVRKIELEKYGLYRFQKAIFQEWYI